MAISSYKVFLMGLFEGATDAGEWRKLTDIKDFPDLIDPPERLQTTTLSNRNHTYIPGIQDTSEKTFTCNYDATEYAKLVALRDHLYAYAVWFGGTEDPTTHAATPTGSDGKFAFIGYLTTSVSGAGVNEVVNMSVSITPASDISSDGSLDWGSNTPALIPTSESGELGAITVSSSAGSAVGATSLSTTNSLGEGESYVYKVGTATAAPIVTYFETPDYTWSAWDGTSANVAVGTAANGKKITVAVINSTGNVIKAGNATLAVKLT